MVMANCDDVARCSRKGIGLARSGVGKQDAWGAVCRAGYSRVRLAPQRAEGAQDAVGRDRAPKGARGRRKARKVP